MTTSSYESLSHAKWDGKYHVVFIPKGRKKALYGKIRSFLGPVLRELAGQRGSTILEGHMVQDHVHMLIRIPPKYAVAGSVPITGTSRSLIQTDRQGRYAPQITFAEGLPRWITRHVTAGIRSAPCMAVWRQTPS